MGYTFTKIGEEFRVLVIDASKGCNSEVYVECDYCGDVTKKPLFNYIKDKKKNVYRDCCSRCSGAKSKDVIFEKYGVDCSQKVGYVKAKTIKTFKERYNCDNPMKNKDVVDKFKFNMLQKYGYEHALQNPKFMVKYKETIMNKFGVEWYQHSDDYKKKSADTCMERYGVEYFFRSDIMQNLRTGENNANWKGGFNHCEDKRNTPEYRRWRSDVFNRDGYTCSCCGVVGGRLNAHHIYNYANHEDIRFDVDNGITLCGECHKLYHNIYGYLNTDEYQLEKFLLMYGKNIV